MGIGDIIYVQVFVCVLKKGRRHRRGPHMRMYWFWTARVATLAATDATSEQTAEMLARTGPRQRTSRGPPNPTREADDVGPQRRRPPRRVFTT